MDAAFGPAGQVPDDIGVDVAEDHLALLSLGAHTFNIVEDPFDLGAGEVGRQRQTDFLAEAILPAVFGELVADRVGAGILPDDRIVDRLAGRFLPHNSGLTLVGDTDRGNIFRGDVTLLERALDHFLGALPDFHRVVFDPAGLRVDLFVFLLIDTRLPCRHDRRS